MYFTLTLKCIETNKTKIIHSCVRMETKNINDDVQLIITAGGRGYMYSLKHYEIISIEM